MEFFSDDRCSQLMNLFQAYDYANFLKLIYQMACWMMPFGRSGVLCHIVWFSSASMFCVLTIYREWVCWDINPEFPSKSGNKQWSPT